MKLKGLLEKRVKLVSEMKDLNEKRDFEGFNAKDDELRTLDTEIEAEKRMIELGTNSVVTDDDTRDFDQEIREAIKAGTELDITEIEIEERAMQIGTAESGNTSVGNIAKTSFANYIIKKLPNISSLYAAVRKEPLSSSNHAIPIQKNKLGKLVKMKELQNYVAQNADYNQIEMKAHKFGTLYVVSDELIEDTGYDIRSDLASQVLESYGQTLDELIIIGDAELGIEGLNDFDKTTGAHEVEQTTTGTITVDDLMSVYRALPRQYRKNATWVFSDATAHELSKLKDSDGRPLLMPSYNGAPFDDGALLLGKPVIINDYVEAEGKSIFFGDLDSSYVVSPRKSFTIKTSTEFGFINDSQATKVNVRLDAKKALEEAMAYLKTTPAALSTRKK